MAITAGQDILASDFVSTPSGAGDSGKVAKLDATGKIPTGFMRFGGDGSDGALSATSGTTTIDLGGAAVFIKNYTSISITGTGAIAFSNPNANGTLIIFKSQGNVTLTSTATAPILDASGCGGAAGAGASTAGGSTTGTNGQNGTCIGVYTSLGGSNTGTGSAAMAASSVYLQSTYPQVYAKYPAVFVGAGGCGGGGQVNSGTGTAVGGAGGRGGGGLIIECAGAWNFTIANGISVAGKNGVNGSHTGSPTNYQAMGGSAGSGGFCEVLYNTLTANSGTVNSSGGTGGTTEYTAGASVTTPGGASSVTAGSNGGITNSSAGNGGNGFSYVGKNTEFA